MSASAARAAAPRAVPRTVSRGATARSGTRPAAPPRATPAVRPAAPAGSLRVVPPARRRIGQAPFVGVVVAVLAAGLLGLLALNTLLAQGSFHLHTLQVQGRQLTDREEVLRHEVDALTAPAALAAAAQAQGLVPGGPPAFLRLSDGAVLGEAAPATAPPVATPSTTASAAPAPSAAAASPSGSRAPSASAAPSARPSGRAAPTPAAARAATPTRAATRPAATPSAGAAR